MKRILIGFLFLFSNLNGDTSDLKLQEIQHEIESLQNQKQLLLKEISENSQKEIRYDMEIQKESIDYKWHALGDSLKKAEAFEHSAHRKEEELHKIEEKLNQLDHEKSALIDLRKNSN